ncbi:MAG: hypothetical protein ABIK62_02720, partial [candidate division WOR-3 bacterium]
QGDYDVDIYCQHLDSSGAPIGRNWVVSQDSPVRAFRNFRQLRPAMATALDGRTIIAWEDYRHGKSGIYYQLLDDSLRPLGENQCASPDTIEELSPAAAALGHRFVLAWERHQDSVATTIEGVVVDNLGRPGPVLRLDDNLVSDSCQTPALAGFNKGFVVAWTQISVFPIQGLVEHSVRIRWFDSLGRPQGQSQGVPSAQSARPKLAADRAGNCVLVWEQVPWNRVLAQPFDSARRALAPPLSLNSDQSIWAARPSVAATPTGERLLAVWDDYQGSVVRICGQLLDRYGCLVGHNFLLDTTARGWQSTASSAVAGGQHFAAAWADMRNQDRNIYAAVYSSCTTRLRINDDRASALQDFPVLVQDRRGRAAIFWFDHRHNSDQPDIFGQRFDTAFRKLGANFRVNDAPPGMGASFLWAACDQAGRSVVTWEDWRLGNPDIFVQIYDSAFLPVGANFRANDNADTSDQTWPYVAMNDSGRFVVLWSDARYDTVAPFAQVFDQRGQRIGHNWPVDSAGREPAAWLANSGEIYVCYKARDGVRLRRFAPDLSPDPLIQQLSDDTCPVAAPEIIGTSLGTLWVVWMDARQGNWDIYCQRVSSKGWPIGPNFRVNDDVVPCDQILPVPSYDRADRIYVTWTDWRIPGNPDVRCQVFDTSGAFLDTSFIVNTDPHPFVQQWAYGSVAARPGSALFVWLDNRNARSWDIYARRGLPTELDRFQAHALMAIPSLVDDRCIIRPAIPVGGLARLRVYNALGQCCRNLEYARGPSRPSLELDCRDLAQGVYCVLLTSGAGVFRGRFVVCR